MITIEKAILASVAKLPGATAEEIAVRVGAEPNVVHAEINSLEAGGYVRSLGMKNGDSSHFVITPQGHWALRF